MTQLINKINIRLNINEIVYKIVTKEVMKWICNNDNIAPGM